jgi:dihydroflavonol-4-reductase
MRVAVTGAGGHLGGVLVRDLIHQGHDVRAIDLHLSETLEGLDVEFVEADVLDEPAMETALDGVDAVCHLAAIISVTGDPTGIVTAVNSQGPAVVADAALAKGVSRMVHCSSVHAFDLTRATDPLTENSVRSIDPALPSYDRSKWMGEQAVQERIERGLNAVIVNPTGIIGPYDFGPSRMGQVLLAIRDGRLPGTIDGGFDWVDVRDVSAGIISAMTNGAAGENYLLSGQRWSIPDLALIAAGISGVEPPRFVLPTWAARAWGPFGTALAQRNNSALSMTSESIHALLNSPEVSSASAETALGYTARPTEESIADTYAWFDKA